MYEADIQAAIDRQLEIERKAAAGDALRQAVVELQWREVLARTEPGTVQRTHVGAQYLAIKGYLDTPLTFSNVRRPPMPSRPPSV